MSCTCPKCGSENYKVGITCCRTKEVICIECCKKCEDYFTSSSGGHGCKYVSETWHDEKTPEQLILNRIQNEIDKKYEKIDYFYRTDRPYIAKRIEAEVHALQYEAAKVRAEIAI